MSTRGSATTKPAQAEETRALLARRLSARPWRSARVLREQFWRDLGRWDEARRIDTAARLACLPPLKLLARAAKR